MEIARAAIRNSSPFFVYQQGNIGLKEEIEYFPKVYSIDFATQRVNRLSKMYLCHYFFQKEIIHSSVPIFCKFVFTSEQRCGRSPDQTENDVCFNSVTIICKFAHSDEQICDTIFYTKVDV